MKERVRFVLEWEKRWNQGEGVVNMSELCREFGVSRESGYKWVNRYKKANYDLHAVEERSRRPKTSPTALDDTMQDLIAGRPQASGLAAWPLPRSRISEHQLRQRGHQEARPRRSRRTRG